MPAYIVECHLLGGNGDDKGSVVVEAMMNTKMFSALMDDIKRGQVGIKGLMLRETFSVS